jgi:rubrerythrin
MTIEEAIKTALEYENKVRDLYRASIANTADGTGKRMLQVLSEDEQRHVEYLESRLDEWKKTGKVTVARLDTTVPSAQSIRQGVEKLEKRMSDKDFGAEIELLKKIRDVEAETSSFYKSLLGKLDADSERLFQRFVEIEDGHLATVQAELDYVSKSGYWFDFNEFSMESAP